jgi:hypothetical protein
MWYQYTPVTGQNSAAARNSQPRALPISVPIFLTASLRMRAQSAASSSRSVVDPGRWSAHPALSERQLEQLRVAPGALTHKDRPPPARMSA